MDQEAPDINAALAGAIEASANQTRETNKAVRFYRRSWTVLLFVVAILVVSIGLAVYEFHQFNQRGARIEHDIVCVDKAERVLSLDIHKAATQQNLPAKDYPLPAPCAIAY